MNTEVMNMLWAIIVYLIGGLFFGYAARRVSEYREMPDGFWWGFWLGWLGLFIVIFRKPAATVAVGTPGRNWRCVKCGTYNSEGRERCQTCGASCDAPDPTKICSSCGAKNKAVNASCFACGHSFES